MKGDDLKILACLLLIALVYSGAVVSGVFQFDDFNVIVSNDIVHNPSLLLADFTHGIRPILKISYFLSWSLTPSPHSFILFNVLVHALNTALVFHLTKSLQLYCPKIQSAHAFFVALLFALHPAHTEAVTYVSGRSSSLMCLFYLAGIRAYIPRACNGENARTLQCALFFILAVLTKETAMTFPIALVLIELLLTSQKHFSLPQILYKQRIIWTLWFALITLFAISRSYFAHFATSTLSNDGVHTLLSLVSGLPYLLGKWLLPIQLNIDPDLSFDFDYQLVAKIILVIILCLLTFSRKLLRNFPLVWFALAWINLQLFFPYIFFPRLDIYNERQLYIISWPVLLALLSPVQSLRLGQALTVVVGLLFTCSTIARNQEYFSEIALWTATAERSPHKSRVFNNLGYVYLKNGEKELARKNFSRAIELDPENLYARNNLDLLN